MTRRSASPMRDEILGRAAVSHYADPALIAEHMKVAPSEVASALFGDVITESDAAGTLHWVLKPSIRRRLLAENAQHMRQWLTVPSSSGDDTDRILREWLAGKLDVNAHLAHDYDALQRVAGWLVDARWLVPSIEDALSALACEELRRRLNQSATKDFVGRDKELKWITQIHQTLRRSVVIEANGGVGKSALLARALLDREAYRPGGWLVFLIDFDDPGLSVTDPDALLAELARQARVQLPEMADVERVLLWTNTALSVQQMIATTRRLEDSRSLALAGYMFERLAAANRPGVVVFDTLERAMHRAPDLVAVMLQQFLSFAAAHPWLSLVISGRGPLAPLADIPRYQLGPLDEKSALALLQQLVTRDTAERILSRVPQLTPLTLRLAARAVEQLGVDVLDDAALDDAILKARIDGYLQRQILGHLATPRLSQVAELAFVLRVITPQRLYRIVGPSLTQPIATIEEATALLDELATMTDLVTSTYVEERRLVLRQEVVEEIVELVREAHPELVRVIHTRAAAILGRSANPDDLDEAEFHAAERDRLVAKTSGQRAASHGDARTTRALHRELAELIEAGRFTTALDLIGRSDGATRDAPGLILGARAARALGDRRRCSALATVAVEIARDPVDRARGHILLAWAAGVDVERARGHRNAARAELLRIEESPATLVERAEIIAAAAEDDHAWAAEQLRAMFDTPTHWAALRDADRDIVRRVCGLIGTAGSLTWAARFSAFTGPHEVDYQRLGSAIARTNTTIFEGLPEVLAKRLRENQNGGFLDELVIQLLRSIGHDAEVRAALVDVLDQLRADPPRADSPPADQLRADQRADLDIVAEHATDLEWLASRISEEVDIGDWRDLLATLGTKPISARTELHDAGLVVRSSLADIDRRKLGGELIEALQGRGSGLAALQWAAASLWKIGDPGMLTGQRLDGYTLGSVIAERGHGLIFAVDQGDRVVKILRHPLDARRRREFNRDVRLSRELAERYPYSFVGVHALEPALGYAVMDRFSTAEEVLGDLRRGAPTVASTFADRALRQLSRALRCLHAEGLAHGDLRAENVFVHVADGEPMFRLGDLCVTGDATTSPAVLQIPEFLRQVAVGGTRPDEWIDLVCLALFAYRLLAGDTLGPELDERGIDDRLRILLKPGRDPVVVHVIDAVLRRRDPASIAALEPWIWTGQPPTFERMPLAPRPLAPFDVFISYDSQDVAVARALDAQLTRRGLVPYFDGRERSSDRWVSDLRSAMDHSRAFAILVGENFRSDGYQAKEVRVAREESRKHRLPFKVFLGGSIRPPEFRDDSAVEARNVETMADVLGQCFQHPVELPPR